jgi:serine/threonine protein phosphatase PrpC
MVLASGMSDRGCKRTKNQDRISIELQSSVFVVADGMGGEQCGELAAEIAVETVINYFRNPRNESGDWPFGYDQQLDAAANGMSTAIQLANLRIIEQSQQIPECAGMGSTISAVSLKGKTATIGGIGDSRVYLYRLNILSPLTKDDSVVAKLVDAGEISSEDARMHPMRNVLTQAAGKAERVRPQTIQMELQHGDKLLLCSDGLHGVVRHDSLCDILNAAVDLDVTARKLISEARRLGAPDNVSCVLIEYLNEY